MTLRPYFPDLRPPVNLAIKDLTIGDILKNQDEKSLIFSDIHDRIIKLCCVRDVQKEKKVRLILEAIKVEDVRSSDFGYESLSLDNLLPKEIESRLIRAYKSAFNFLENNEPQNKYFLEQKAELKSVGFSFKSDLQLLNDAYKTLQHLEFSSTRDYSLKASARAKRSAISERASMAAKIKDEKKYGPARRRVYELWDSGRWLSPPKAAEDIHQEAREEGNPYGVSVLKITQWIRDYRKSLQ